MADFKVGDRVRVYGHGGDMGQKNHVGQIVQIHDKSGWVRVEPLYRTSFWVHPKQCRRLIKKERKRIWIPKSFSSIALTGIRVGGWDCFLKPPPQDQDSFIEFVEVRRG